jgi:hypothetical protein
MRAALMIVVFASGSLLAPRLALSQESASQDQKDDKAQKDAKKPKEPKPVRVFTNDDLEQGRPEGSTPATTSTPPPSSTPPPTAGAPPGPPRGGQEESEGRRPRREYAEEGDSAQQPTRPTRPADTSTEEAAATDGRSAEENSFRQRYGALKSAVSDAEEAVKTLEQSSTDLFWQTLRSSDTNEILRLKGEQGDTAASLEQAKKQVETAKQQLADFEAESRRSGVPSHWYRDPPK